MTWNWYSARSNELFVDIDRFEKSKKHIERRLQGAIESEALKVKEVFIYPSLREDHRHMIVVLNSPLMSLQRYTWEMMFHGDIYRAAANIMRYTNKIPNPDILISKIHLHRSPDGVCKCESKHNRATMLTCPTAFAFREEGVAPTFFGKPSNENPKWRIF